MEHTTLDNMQFSEKEHTTPYNRQLTNIEHTTLYNMHFTNMEPTTLYNTQFSDKEYTTLHNEVNYLSVLGFIFVSLLLLLPCIILSIYISMCEFILSQARWWSSFWPELIDESG